MKQYRLIVDGYPATGWFDLTLNEKQELLIAISDAILLGANFRVEFR